MESTIRNRKQVSQWRRGLARLLLISAFFGALIPGLARADVATQGNIGSWTVASYDGFTISLGVDICPDLPDWWRGNGAVGSAQGYSVDQVKAQLATIIAAKLSNSRVTVWTSSSLVPGVCSITKIWVMN